MITFNGTEHNIDDASQYLTVAIPSFTPFRDAQVSLQSGLCRTMSSLTSRPQSCRQFILYFRVELILGVVIVGGMYLGYSYGPILMFPTFIVTLILRTYALYQRNNKVLTLMVSVSAVLIAMACVSNQKSPFCV